MTAAILQLFPRLTDVNGDAQNAAVLARRAAWAGLDAELVVLHPGDAVPAVRPQAVVLGSGVDSSLVRVREALEPWEPALADWAHEGVHIIGIGTGFELLGRSVQIAAETVTGLGLLPGRSAALPDRAAGEIVVESDLGLLVGYENHARGYTPEGGPETPVAPLGRVRHGVGNGDGFEGARNGSVIGTHLHGPLLARNPRIADLILGAGGADSSSDLERADLIAQRTVASALRRTGTAPGSAAG